MSSSFLSQATSNTKVQFATTAIVSGAVVASAILGYQQLQRNERINKLKDSIPSAGADRDALGKVSSRLLRKHCPAMGTLADLEPE